MDLSDAIRGAHSSGSGGSDPNESVKGNSNSDNSSTSVPVRNLYISEFQSSVSTRYNLYTHS